MNENRGNGSLPGGSAVALLRRSTGMQDKSLAEQREHVQAWAKQWGYSIVGEYVDDVVSGDDHRHRSGFKRLLNDVRSPRKAWNMIVTWDRSRFTRADVFEAGSYSHTILESNADVYFVCEKKQLSEDNPIVWAVETDQKNQVLKQTSKDTLRGMIGLARKGFWCGGPLPYATDAEIVDKVSGKAVRRIRLICRKHRLSDGSCEPAIHHILDTDGKLTRTVESSIENDFPLKSDAELTRPILSEQPRVNTVKDIFRMVAYKQQGYKAIARELNKRQIPPPGGRGKWRSSAVKAILDNPIYMGIYEWNSRTEAKYHSLENGSPVARTRQAKGKVVLHEENNRVRVNMPQLALVSTELWHRAQAVRAKRADIHYRPRRAEASHSPLGGRIICEDCGAKMYAHRTQKTKTVGGKPKTYTSDRYVCSTYLTSGVGQCKLNAIERAQIEGFVMSQLRSILSQLRGSSQIRSSIRQRLKEQLGGSKTTNVKAMEKELAKLERKIAILDRMPKDDREALTSEADYHEGKATIARLTRELSTHRQGSRTVIDLDLATNEAMECLTNLDNFDRLPADDQKSLMGRFVDSIKLRFEDKKGGKLKRRTLRSGTLELMSLPPGLVTLPLSPKVSRLSGSGGGL